jgi:glycosyltransferase involved in cell wall biosynthesis
MKILFVSPFLPWPQNIGVALRMHSILTALQLIGDVECVFFGDDNYIKKLPEGVIPRVVKVLPFPDLVLWPLIGRLFRLIPSENREWWLSYLPGFQLFYPSSIELKKQFSDIDFSGYDLAFFVRIPTLWWLRWKSPIPTVVDLDDVMHLGLLKSSQSENTFIKKIIKTWHYINVKYAEVGSLSSVSGGFVCSDDDARSISDGKITVLSNIFPDRGQLNRDIPVVDSPIILFVGALVYKPNREALDFFIKEIFPLIRKSCPQAILRIVGRTGVDQKFSWANEAGVEFLGTVENIDPIIETAAIEICPMLYGLGTRIKILEALSFGKAVVSTSVGAHGIDLNEQSGLFRADSPEKFADTCIALLNNIDLRRSLAPFTREGVSARYGQDRVNSIIKEVILKVTTPSVLI